MILCHRVWSSLKRPRRVYSLEELREVRKSLDNNVKKHVNYIATSWCTYGALMDDVWTLG